MDWKRLGITSTYTAYSMTEAIERFFANDIDLLLTDIEMRGGSGFDLIQWANEQAISYVGIILSGFPYFHYAQRAIRFGVFEYLLKPVDDVQLESTLLRSVNHLQKTRNGTPDEVQVKENPIIERARNYIYDHLSGEINRNELAAHVGLSPAYFSIFFKKETGKTLTDYINTERVGMAKRMLKQTNLPIGIISENVGYESLAYFSSVFRRIVGYTPREYRNKANAKNHNLAQEFGS
jgi:two-component system sensor histidine kinase YesM